MVKVFSGNPDGTFMASIYRTILVACATLMFMSAFLMPCFCSTAVATETVREGACPCSEKESPEDEHGDCCCGCDGAKPLDVGDDVPEPSEGALTSSEELDSSSEFSTSWWSPELLVALWLIHRLEDCEAVSTHPPPLEDRVYRDDGTQTYLKNSTFLI